MTTIGHPPPSGRFVVRALKSTDGWELHVEGEGMIGDGVTRVAGLDDAEQQVRDYLAARFDDDFSHAVIEIVS